MARIDSRLFQRLQTVTGLGKSRVYALIDERVRSSHLPRDLAAIALAAERGINISRFASTDDLASIRQAARSTVPQSVVVPTTTQASKTRKPARARKAAPRRGNSVWVVHGRNTQARDAIFAFLRSIGLTPIEWNQAVKKTKQGSPYVGAILESAFREAVAVVVVLTPDDEARLKPEFLTSTDGAAERRLNGQARANVLFEAGMAFGRNPDSTVLLQLGDLRPFSDVAGRHVVRMSDAPTSRQELATKLANAGCNVDTSGSDWLSAGTFALRGRPATRRRKRSGPA